MKRRTRREMLENCIVRGLLVGGASMSASQLLAFWEDGERGTPKATPSEVLGPFFKKGAPNTSVLRQAGDPGFPLRVSGKVLNTRGKPVNGALVEVWQANHHGRYDVEGYRYRAKLQTGELAEYSLETVMPGHYSDRPAQHIHYLISAPGHKTLVTQIYFANDEWFEGDVDKNYNKRNLVGNREQVRPVTLYEQGTPRAAVSFDIVLEQA